MFKFLIENDLISSNQSGFKSGDSCINQLFSITHDIYESFDWDYEVRGGFFDILKTFDKVSYHIYIRTKWHILKITQTFT